MIPYFEGKQCGWTGEETRTEEWDGHVSAAVLYDTKRDDYYEPAVMHEHTFNWREAVFRSGQAR